jgi:hypothetical protein
LLGQIDDELHADGPITSVVALGHAEVLIELLADWADGAVADYGEGGMDIHARREVFAGTALLVDALVEEADA